MNNFTVEDIEDSLQTRAEVTAKFKKYAILIVLFRVV